MEILKNSSLEYLKNVLDIRDYKIGFQYPFKKITSTEVTNEIQLLAYNLKTGVIIVCETLYKKVFDLRAYCPNVNGLTFRNIAGFKSGTYRQLELSILDIDNAFDYIDNIINTHSTSNIWDESNIIRLNTSQEFKNAFDSNTTGRELYNLAAERLLLANKEIESILGKCKTLEPIFMKREELIQAM